MLHCLWTYGEVAMRVGGAVGGGAGCTYGMVPYHR